MTYQRNKYGSLQDGSNQRVEDGVEEPEVGAGEDHEAQHHRGALADVPAIGPLDALQLRPAGREEADHAREEPAAARRLRVPAGHGPAAHAGLTGGRRVLGDVRGTVVAE